MMRLVDWDDLRFFLAVARTGNHAQAANSLRVERSTVGRRIASLEAAIGARLLRRTREGHVLTEAGEAILAQVERIEAETLELVSAARGQDSRLEGTVRVMAPDFVANRLLVPAFSALSLRYPKISIEMIENRDPANFSPKEGDISIRPLRFEQESLIVRSLGSLSFGLYVSESYIEKHGMPRFDDACEGHRLILGRDVMASPIDPAWLQDMTGRATVALKAASFETLLGAVASGYGIGALPHFAAEGIYGPRLVRLNPDKEAPAVELWMGMHRETRNVARVRKVIDAVTEAIAGGGRALKPLKTPPDVDVVADWLEEREAA
jgi:DNA-binding transcriptional LysR family regulator